MTDRTRECLRCSGYIVVGLFAGLAIGIGVGPQVREFLMNKGWPNESISWITMSLVFVSIFLNGFLYNGLKKGDHRRSVTNPSPQSES